jgi:dethiobiotin synthetase/adenosylmethionine--8-amino-7-oxononanoate aminotransferase
MITGYTSTAAVSLRDSLLNDAPDKKIRVHSRILGNVIYFMASMSTKAMDLADVEKALMEKLGK